MLLHAKQIDDGFYSYVRSPLRLGRSCLSKAGLKTPTCNMLTTPLSNIFFHVAMLDPISSFQKMRAHFYKLIHNRPDGRT